MVNVYKQIKILFFYLYKRTYFYNFFIRFNFNLNLKPASLKERYKLYPWKKFFRKRWWFFFPANTKKIYWPWFTVKLFYTPPTKKFVAPSIIMQKYFPEYDILQDEVITNAWKAVNAHYYLRWQRELYWYKLRARFSQENSWGFFGSGLFPHYWWDGSSSRRPLKYKYIPSWDLVKLLAALDLLWWKMPKKTKWEKRLRLRLHVNKRLNGRIDKIGFLLHIIFWYPIKGCYQLFWKYGIGYLANFQIKTVKYITLWRHTWRQNSSHRRHGFLYWTIRSSIIFFFFTIPTLTLTKLIADLQYLFCQGNPLLWELAGFNSQNWIKYGTPEHRELLGILTDEPLGVAITFNIILFFINIVISFSPKLWAWFNGFGQQVLRSFWISFFYLCPITVGSMLDIDWMYDVVPISGCFFFATFWYKWDIVDVEFFDMEADKGLPLYEDMPGNLKQKEYTLPFLKALYKNPDWKETGSLTSDMLVRREIEDGERHMAAYIDSFKKTTFNFRIAFWRKRHRYLYFFAELWIERNNLKEKDPKKFLVNWLKGLYAFWDTELNNASNLYEWEKYGRNPQLKQPSTFTKARKKKLYKDYLDFWEFFVQNVTRRVGSKKDIIEYNEEFAHIISKVDGEPLGSSEILSPLHGNKDQDLLHCMYYDSFRLQQAVWNEDLMVVWEEGRLITSALWSEDAIMNDFIQRGFDERTFLSHTDNHNRRHGFWEYHMEVFGEEDETERRGPTIGPPKGAINIRSGMLRYNAKLMDIDRFQTEEEKDAKTDYIKYKYDRRWPAKYVALLEKTSIDWSQITQKGFYSYFIRRWTIMQNLFTIKLMEAFIVVHCLFDKKRNHVRSDVMKELFMLKYINLVYPTSLLYVFHFIKTMDFFEFINEFFKDYEQFENIVTLTAEKYRGIEYTNQILVDKELQKSLNTLDIIFESAMADSGIKAHWAKYKETNKAWKALWKEKTYTEKIYEDLVRVEFENYYLKVNLKKKLISKEFYAKMVRIFAMQMALFIDKKKNLEWIRRINEEHLFFTKHYHITLGMHKAFLGRYEFPSVTVENKSGYLVVLYKKDPFIQRFFSLFRVSLDPLLNFLKSMFDIKGLLDRLKKSRLEKEKERKRKAVEWEADIAKARKIYNAVKKKENHAKKLRANLKGYKHLTEEKRKELTKNRWKWW